MAPPYNWVTGEDIPPEDNLGPDGWEPGQTTRQIEAECCPECGSLRASRKMIRNPVTYWSCRDCGRSWKKGYDCNPCLAKRLDNQQREI